MGNADCQRALTILGALALGTPVHSLQSVSDVPWSYGLPVATGRILPPARGPFGFRVVVCILVIAIAMFRLLLLSGVYRIRTDDPLVDSQVH